MNCVHHIKENVKARFSQTATKMGFSIAKSFSTVVEKSLWMKLQAKSEKTFEYLANIPITQWWNTQWVTTKKLSQSQRLPAQCGIVTSKPRECINSMIEELWGEAWTKLLDGTLHHMM